MNAPKPIPLQWDRETLNRFWSYYSGTPELYFSYSKGADVVRRCGSLLKSGVRVMDYGCGPGYLLRHLIRTGCEVWGGDFSEDVVGKAGHDIIGVPNFRGIHTISSLLGSEQFDVVFLLEVIEHLDDAALDETMGNINQLLRRGGRLVVTTPNDERLEESIVYSPVANVTFHRWQHVRSWSSVSLSSFLQRRGYDPVVSAVNFRDSNESISLRNRIGRFLRDRFEKPAGLYAVATKL
ncbi:hypothetical protein C7U92_06935 [Bradyrhizobium sp. WBOS7]|uniref:Class I SAM-dependent methyltransferase n=1 Tax=Bradyrhizobium betae TaxID=244734 RepID=A0AAE9NGR3_9BRAD|nr:hypothetical protein [Bradyrhizobium sp. WBOS2]MDD1569352.1 hypothetical protein [Bradyrhizobium sp. WBOS1]MDD1576471.1 hypothetical protein [Bradyrhizobium sp. WBOS7]MDD1602312.1 hypothetical protein [Bradyrhizobium sp. WBOS16]UUO38145.1 hypothetical protein DCK84_28545 [Bradyrhizobium sp. WBOS01]UUO44311.1 hypothetical protein DCM75_28515 [Bradyrhizobium sp. WBOS02]UUO54719.1 hypothetical protein DCM79_18110 [Bradyrhizobium sp. WBOS07]UUO68720.1 hypothetical protein DCM83_28220 [Bradyrh